MQGMQSNGTLSAPGFAQMDPSHKALRPQANRVGVICTKISARRRVLVRHRASTVCSAAVASYQLAGRSSSSRRRSSRRGEKGETLRRCVGFDLHDDECKQTSNKVRRNCRLNLVYYNATWMSWQRLCCCCSCCCCVGAYIRYPFIYALTRSLAAERQRNNTLNGARCMSVRMSVCMCCTTMAASALSTCRWRRHLVRTVNWAKEKDAREMGEHWQMELDTWAVFVLYLSLCAICHLLNLNLHTIVQRELQRGDFNCEMPVYSCSE